MRAEAAQAREVSQGVELSLVRRAAGASGAALSGDGCCRGRRSCLTRPCCRYFRPCAGCSPVGALRRGSVVAAGPWSLLCLALAAGASAAGAWCAVVGLPQLGVAAAAAAGLDPDRMLLIADPGTGWPQVVASLLDGCELVLLRPPDRPPAQVRRRIEATVRRFGGVLVWRGSGTVRRPGSPSPSRNGRASEPATGGCVPAGSRWSRTAGAGRRSRDPSGCGFPDPTGR